MILQHIRSNYNIDGQIVKGMGRIDLYKMFHKAGFSVGCEIGVHAAGNALVMFQNIPGLKLYLVEPYADHECSIAKWGEYNKNNISSHENAKKRARKALAGYNVEWLEMFSEDAAGKVQNNSLDFIHIDGEHSYDFGMIDIILWSRKVRVGGVASGHDYNDWEKEKPLVTRAVDDYTSAHKISFYYTDISRDRRASWFFIKA